MRGEMAKPPLKQADRALVIGELPQEWKTEWNRMVPGKRFCAPYELKGV